MTALQYLLCIGGLQMAAFLFVAGAARLGAISDANVARMEQLREPNEVI